MDIKVTFLNEDLKENVMHIFLEGFVIVGFGHKVYKYHKAIYGLKQTSQVWYEKIDTYFVWTRNDKSSTWSKLILSFWK